MPRTSHLIVPSPIVLGHLGRRAARPAIAMALSAMLIACGGGGDDGAEPASMPVFVEQPAGADLNSGSRAEFHARAEAAGRPIDYQWYLDGEAIEGATGPSLVIDEVDADHHGARVSVRAESEAGSVVSEVAVITVDGALVSPRIESDIEVDDLPDGERRLSVRASGSGMLSYQWRQGDVDIAGATAREYVVRGTTGSDGVGEDDPAGYSVVVSNADGSDTSREKVLRSDTAAGPILTPPRSVMTVPGRRATFTVVLSGTSRVRLQWLRDGLPIAGATRPSYTTPTLTLADDGSRYAVVVTSVAGEVKSSAATLRVVEAAMPTLGKQPVDAWLSVSKRATFSVTASGGKPYTYRWYRDGEPIAGATSSAYTTDRLGAGDDAAAYHVVVTNPAGVVTSRVVRARVTGVTTRYPVKPIRLVVPTPPGDPTDTIARALAVRLGDDLGQPVIVSTVGTGSYGAARVARSEADGYTVMLDGNSFVTTGGLSRLPSYVPTRDFVAIGVVAERPLLLMGRPGMPSTVQRLLPWLASQGGKASIVASGRDSASERCARLLTAETGAAMTILPTRGDEPALMNVRQGRVDLYCGTPPQPRPAELRAYGVTTLTRSNVPAHASLPTLDSRGLDDFRMSVDAALYAPAATPTAIVTKLNAAMRRIQKDPAFVAQLHAIGAGLVTDTRSSPKGHGLHMLAESARWAPILKD